MAGLGEIPKILLINFLHIFFFLLLIFFLVRLSSDRQNSPEHPHRSIFLSSIFPLSLSFLSFSFFPSFLLFIYLFIFNLTVFQVRKKMDQEEGVFDCEMEDDELPPLPSSFPPSSSSSSSSSSHSSPFSPSERRSDAQRRQDLKIISEFARLLAFPSSPPSPSFLPPITDEEKLFEDLMRALFIGGKGAVSDLRNKKKSSVCGAIWKQGKMAYRCRDCQVF